MTVQVKRVFDTPSPADGYRVLVDRLWPRGVRKEALHHDEWAKDVAPSTELRRDFHHGDLSFGEFADRYRAELHGPAQDAVTHLRELAGEHATLTLLTATKDESHNHAVVLASVIGDEGR